MTSRTPPATLAEWQDDGVLVRDGEPSLWWLAQDFTGPGRVARRRDGLVAALGSSRTTRA